VAIGCAGIASVLDLRGQSDLFGRPLRVTVVGHADELAAAASILMGQASEARPVILISGLGTQAASAPAAAALRPPEEDLFR
jgi:coenzyme F420-0:L-glutamate ligase/coenzyme F420-1:gamma-L-glutamate ligase